MPIVKLPDGTLVQLPDTPEEAPSFGDRMANSLYAGAQKTGAGLFNLPVLGARAVQWGLNKAGVPDKPGSMLSEFTQPNEMDRIAAEAEKLSSEKGLKSGFGRAMVEAAPGAILSPAGSAKAAFGLGRSLLANEIPTIAGEASAKLLGENMRAPVSIMTGLVSGGALGPRLSAAKGDINEALTGTTPAQFSEVAKNSQLFRDAGIPSATIGEAFPPGSAIMTLADRARKGSISNDLRTKTANREEDLMAAGDEFKRRLVPGTQLPRKIEVDQNTVANQAGGAATEIELLAKRRQQNNITAALAGKDIDPMEVADIYNNLLLAGANSPRTNVGNAYREVAKRLIAQDGTLLTNLQELSYAIRDLKQGMKNPLSPTFGDPSLDKAIGVVDSALKRKSPDYKAAMEGFAAEASQRAELRQGPIGSLADKNPLVAGQTPVSRMEGLLSGNSADTVKKTALRLGSPLETSGKPVAPIDIARALAKQKLANRPSDPGLAVRGNPGSDKEANFNALLEAGGVNVTRANQPLQAADKLQTFKNKTGLEELPKMQWRQALLRPFRTLDMMLTAKNEHAVNTEIANLLARNDPQILGELQKIAMFDPMARKGLSLMTAANMLSQSQGK